jgi:hypothetical protein
VTNELGLKWYGDRFVETKPGSRHSGTTLGRLRKSRAICPGASGATVDVWRPCWTPAPANGLAEDFRDERGRIQPHVFYASTAGAGCSSILCPDCRVARARRELARRGGVILVCEHCDLPHRHFDGVARVPVAVVAAAESPAIPQRLLDLPF